MDAQGSGIPHEMRQRLLSRLRENNSQALAMQTIFESHTELLNQVNLLSERLRRNSASVAAGTSGENEEQLRNEMNEIIRRKEVNDQQLIEKSTRLEKSEKRCAMLQKAVNDNDETVKILRAQTDVAETNASDMQKANQLLRDENLALQATCHHLEEKNSKLSLDNNDLVARWNAQISQKVQAMNDANQQEVGAMQKRRETQLADAVNAMPVPVFDGRSILLPTLSGMSSGLGVMGVDCLPNKCQLRFQAHSEEVSALRFTRHGSRLATGGIDKKLYIWQLNGRAECKTRLIGCNQSVMSIDFDTTNQRCIASSNDMSVRLWNVATERCQDVFTGHSGKVQCVRFYNQGRQAISGSHDKTIKIWDLSAKKCRRSFFVGSTVLDICTSEMAASAIVSGHYDGKLRVWDERQNEPMKEILLSGKITSVDMLHDGWSVLAATKEDTIHLVDMRTNRIVHNYCGEAFHMPCDYARACISPQGLYLACGSGDGSVYIWSVETTRVEKVLSKGGHEGAPIISTVWHPEGHQVVTCDKKGVVCVWEQTAK